MDGATLSGGFADPPRDAAHAFRAAMTAMARPGRIVAIAGDSLQVVAQKYARGELAQVVQ